MEIDKIFHDKIADLCLSHFKTLPKSGKPKISEWTVLSCIVLEFASHLSVVALGTGSKCIGKSKLSSSGNILNDSHAEVICRRSFLRFIYSQMKYSRESSFIYFNTTSKKYVLKDNVKFHFFTTHVPCGDAAIFPKQTLEDFGCLIEGSEYGNDDYEVPIKRSKREETDIFRTGGKCLLEDEKQDSKLPGCAYHVLGAVRTKPGRGDPTLSVSCSDKLAKWCHLGIQGTLLSLLLEKPIYLSSFTIAANTPFCSKALDRALYSRLGNVELNYPYFQSKMIVEQSTHEFHFYKTSEKQPCPSSISWCNVREKSLEVAVEGKRQGVTKKNLDTAAGRLNICKLQLFKYFIETCQLHDIILKENCDIKTLCYRDIKMVAIDYKNYWELLRQSFKIWTNKNEELLTFFVE